MLDYLLLALAVLRLYYLLAYDNGPANVILLFRMRIGVKYDMGQAIPTNNFAYALLCEYCATLYYSLIIVTLYTLYPTPTIVFSSILALSMVAAIIVGGLKRLGI